MHWSLENPEVLIRGARQVGKTFTAWNLGGTFDELVEVNFERTPALVRVFEKDLDPKRIVRDLRLLTRQRIEPGLTSMRAIAGSL